MPRLPVGNGLPLRRISGVAVLLFCTAGCMSHPEMVQRVKSDLANSGTASTKPFDGRLEGKDSTLIRMERGRLHQLLGNYEASSADYQAAVAEIQAREERAVVSATAIGAQVGASLVNDLAIPYEGEGYERIMLFQLDAFNRLARGNLEEAGINVRNMARQLQNEMDRYEREIQQVDAAKDEAVAKTMQSTEFTAAMAQADALAAGVLNSFQNGYVYAFAGAFYEGRRDWGNATIAYERALRLQPQNGALRYSLWRMLRRANRELPPQLRGQEDSLSARTPADGEGEVFFFFEWGYNIEKQAFQIPLILPAVGIIMTSIPFYNVHTETVGLAEIRDGSGKVLATADPAADFRALAARALKERMPGIVTRQIIRATAKGAANYAANEANEWAGLAMMIFNAASEQPDLRSWLLLPRYAQIARFPLPAGTHELDVTFGAQRATQTVEVNAGRITLLHGMGVPGRMTTSSTPF